jgi:hypothetical protein
VKRNLIAVGSFIGIVLALNALGATPLRAVILSECPSSGERVKSFSLAGSAVTQLIGISVDLIGAALRSAAETKNELRSAKTKEVDFYRFDPNTGDIKFNAGEIGCLVILDADTEPRTMDSTETPAQPLAPDKLKWLNRDGVIPDNHIVGTPRFYFEARIQEQEKAPIKDKIKISPRMLYVQKFFASNWFSKKNRAYSITLSFRDPITLEVFGSTHFFLKNVSQGQGLLDPDDYEADGNRLELEKISDWPSSVLVNNYPQTSSLTAIQKTNFLKIEPYLFANAAFRSDMALQDNPRLQPEDNKDFRDQILSKYCEALKRTNAERPVSAKQFDDRCPVDMLEQRQLFKKEREAEQKRLDKEWANKFADDHREQCPKPSANESKQARTCKLPALDYRTAGTFVIDVAVVETREPVAFIKAMARGFAEKSDDIKTMLDDKLNPVKRAEAEAADRNARNAFEVSKLKVAELEAALAEASDKRESERLAIQISLTQAKIQANKDARAAGLPIPYPEYN